MASTLVLLLWNRSGLAAEWKASVVIRWIFT